ncbi:hypothetical protein TNCT_647181, partial [Trichonephila clavata]
METAQVSGGNLGVIPRQLIGLPITTSTANCTGIVSENAPYIKIKSDE